MRPEGSLGRLPCALPRPSPGPLNQSEGLVSGRVPEFMSICGWASGEAPAGWEWGCRGAAGGCREAPGWHMPQAAWLCEAWPGCTVGHGARLRQTVCLPQCRLLIGTLTHLQSSLSISQSPHGGGNESLQPPEGCLLRPPHLLSWVAALCCVQSLADR
uniref:Uncharacterized protein n=1 Tax=Molossus molossus TaxID=27622 RepID=A0A7J8C932_MOLMO|nr:hypothetical protein HJG59_010000 [Molossus molossus]